jgi:hypothetical protein
MDSKIEVQMLIVLFGMGMMINRKGAFAEV